jgi:xanthosine utilization system XapX-like protein
MNIRRIVLYTAPPVIAILGILVGNEYAKVSLKRKLSSGKPVVLK